MSLYQISSGGLLSLDTVKWKNYVVSVNDAAVRIRLFLQGVSKGITPCLIDDQYK
jgi:hypothetical protein